MFNAFKVAAAVIWSGALLIGFWKVATKTKKLSDQHYELLAPPPLSEFGSNLIDIITLGFRPLYDDMTTIWTMQYLYDSRINAYSPEEVHATLLKTTRHQPKSPGLYLSSCFYLALSRDRPDLCELLILDGMKALPNEWRLPATQGFMEAFRLKNISKAVVYYSIAATLPDSPEFMQTAVASLNKLGKIDTNTLNSTLQSIAGDAVDSNIAEFIHQVIQQKSQESNGYIAPTPEESAP